MNIKISRPCCYFLKYLFQNIFWNSCSLIIWWILFNSFYSKLIILKFIIFLAHYFLIIRLIFFQVRISFILNLFFSQNSFFYNFLSIRLENCWHVLNFLVHFWLCKERLILLVMSISSISYNINEYIFFEFKSISSSNPYAHI
jgi:hypothetical protein